MARKQGGLEEREQEGWLRVSRGFFVVEEEGRERGRKKDLQEKRGVC